MKRFNQNRQFGIRRFVKVSFRKGRFAVAGFIIVRQSWMKAKYLIAGVKTREVRRQFIITLMADPPSRRAAEQCRQSIGQHGGGGRGNVEYFAAVDERHSEELLRKHGITWKSMGIARHQKALMGCFASHFLLWLKCLELNEPIMILECDALCVSALPSRLRFRHVINLADIEYRRDLLGRGRLLELLDTQPFQGSVDYMKTSMPGTVAYALSPAGARRLVGATKKRAACEADLFINKDIVDIIEHHPLPVRVNAGFPSYIERQTDLLG